MAKGEALNWFNCWPQRVWEQTPGGWVSREPENRGRVRRVDMAKDFHAAREEERDAS